MTNELLQRELGLTPNQASLALILERFGDPAHPRHAEKTEKTIESSNKLIRVAKPLNIQHIDPYWAG